ncbi:MAG: PilW family protein, partial [Metallibacterium sp.]
MKRALGFSLVELMVAIAIGLVILAGVITVFVAQRQVYGTATAQASIQNAENAIAAMVAPAVRGAGFAGCGAFSTTGSIIDSGSLAYNFSAPLFGYGANTPMTALNAANVSNTGDWTPALDSSLAGLSEAGSDMIVVGGELPGTIPVPVTNIVGNSGQLSILSQPFPPPSTATVQPGMIGAVSDCSKSIAFTIYSQAANSTNIIIHHDQGTGTGSNKQANFA